MMLAEAAARAATARRIALATASASLDVSSDSPLSPNSPPSSPYRLLSAFEKSHPRRVTTKPLQSPTVKEAIKHARGVLDESKLLDERHGNSQLSVLEKEVADLQAALTEKNKSLVEMLASISLKDTALEKSKSTEMALRQELASLTMRFAAMSSLGVFRGGGGGGGGGGITPLSPFKVTLPATMPMIATVVSSPSVVSSPIVSTSEKDQSLLEKEEAESNPTASSYTTEVSESTLKKSSGRWSKNR